MISLVKANSHRDKRCQGYYDTDPSNSSKPFVICGGLRSVPKSDNETQRRDINTRWSQQLYTCASSTMASVKSVTFRTTGEMNLDSIRVVSVEDKVWPTKDKPSWAIEKVSPDYKVNEIDLLWGLVSNDVPSSPTLEIRETDELFLPASKHYQQLTQKTIDMNAAGRAFSNIWESTYIASAGSTAQATGSVPLYVMIPSRPLRY